MKLWAACCHKLFMSADSMKTRDINSVPCAAGSTTTTVAFIKLKRCKLERLLWWPTNYSPALPCPVPGQWALDEHCVFLIEQQGRPGFYTRLGESAILLSKSRAVLNCVCTTHYTQK